MTETTNTFRTTYRELSQADKDNMNGLKSRAETVLELLNQLPATRERSLAITKLEEAVMWGVKGITG
jgi:hypothetical protein